MSPFEQFSEEIKEVAKIHSKSLIARLVWRAQYHWLRWINQPLPFAWVEEEEGEPVGKPIDIYHLHLHDMMEHEARGQLTGKVLLEGLRANAFAVIGWEEINHMNAKTIIQPRWI